MLSGTSPSVVTLPLYKKGVEKDKFEMACIWLKDNIRQILTFRDIEYEPLQNILYNLDKFFMAHEYKKVDI